MCRKWNTLVKTYNKAKDDNNVFHKEMDELLGGQHHVVGTSRGLVVRRLGVLGQCSGLLEEMPSCDPSSPAASDTSSTMTIFTATPDSPSPTSATPRTRKRKRDFDIQY